MENKSQAPYITQLKLSEQTHPLKNNIPPLACGISYRRFAQHGSKQYQLLIRIVGLPQGCGISQPTTVASPQEETL